MTHPITAALRESVVGYFLAANEDDKLRHFNKLVTICTSNTVKLFIPCRTVGIGKRVIDDGEKAVKDNLIKDLAEEFVLETLFDWLGRTEEVVQACEDGKFDYMGHTFRQRVLNKIRDVSRSKEEQHVESLENIFEKEYETE